MALYRPKHNICYLCDKPKEDCTDHHIVPKILRGVVPDINDYTIRVCKHCHNKLHRLLPMFYKDGSYRWRGTRKWDTITPEWEEWSKKCILTWDGEDKNEKA